MNNHIAFVPHTPKAVTYHEQSQYCRFMIGHSIFPHSSKGVTYHEESYYCRFMIGHSLCPHSSKAVTYHAQSYYCRFMIGHSLGRMGISYFLTTFPFIWGSLASHSVRRDI